MYIFKKIKKFVARTLKAIWNTITFTVKDVVNNAESVVILIAATIGVSTVLSELPYHILLPMWIEGPMVLPVLSIMIIYLLTLSMKWRLKKA